MKKLITCVAAAALVFSLAACGSSAPDNKVFSKDDLEGKKIGVQLGTTGDIAASEIKDADVKQFNKGNDAVQALKQGKVDAVIIDQQPAKAFVEKNDDLNILDEEFKKEEYAIAIAKDKSELKTKINEALATLKSNGTLQSIIDNYIGDDTKGKTPYKSPENVERSNGTLTMATNATFEPYEYYDNNEIVGIDVDMMRAVCDILGMELKVQDMEFDAIINAVQSGKADVGVAGMTITEDRLASIDFTEPYTTATQVIIVRK